MTQDPYCIFLTTQPKINTYGNWKMCRRLAFFNISIQYLKKKTWKVDLPGLWTQHKTLDSDVDQDLKHNVFVNPQIRLTFQHTHSILDVASVDDGTRNPTFSYLKLALFHFVHVTMLRKNFLCWFFVSV